MKRRKLRYYVLTWDLNKQTFTPQIGVRKGPYSLFGLRKPLRALRGIGYSADRNDGYVYVYSLHVVRRRRHREAHKEK